MKAREEIDEFAQLNPDADVEVATSEEPMYQIGIYEQTKRGVEFLYYLCRIEEHLMLNDDGKGYSKRKTLMVDSYFSRPFIKEEAEKLLAEAQELRPNKIFRIEPYED